LWIVELGFDNFGGSLWLCVGSGYGYWIECCGFEFWLVLMIIDVFDLEDYDVVIFGCFGFGDYAVFMLWWLVDRSAKVWNVLEIVKIGIDFVGCEAWFSFFVLMFMD
jgi:hypothetical protein